MTGVFVDYEVGDWVRIKTTFYQAPNLKVGTVRQVVGVVNDGVYLNDGYSESNRPNVYERRHFKFEHVEQCEPPPKNYGTGELRDMFAKEALCILIQSGWLSVDDTARKAYDYADAMLRARNE